MKCSNCNNEAASGEGINVCLGQEGESITRICEACLTNVMVLKVVMARQDVKKPFSFEGYLPVSCVK